MTALHLAAAEGHVAVAEALQGILSEAGAWDRMVRAMDDDGHSALHRAVAGNRAAMVEWLLDTRYRHLFNAVPEGDASVMVYGLPESAITPLMQEVELQFKGLKTYSLPSVGEGGVRRHIELGAKGDAAQVAPAFEQLRAGALALGGTIG